MSNEGYYENFLTPHLDENQGKTHEPMILDESHETHTLHTGVSCNRDNWEHVKDLYSTNSTILEYVPAYRIVQPSAEQSEDVSAEDEINAVNHWIFDSDYSSRKSTPFINDSGDVVQVDFIALTAKQAKDLADYIYEKNAYITSEDIVPYGKEVSIQDYNKLKEEFVNQDKSLGDVARSFGIDISLARAITLDWITN